MKRGSNEYRKMKLMRGFGLWMLVLVVGLAGCAEKSEPGAETTADGKTKVTLALNWFPEAEHGGYYAALVHGYFAEEGLEVEIIPGGPGAPVIPQVDRGDVTFGITNADDLLLARAQEAETVAVFAALQTSPRSIMVHKASGIENFDQLSNVTLAMNSGKAFAQFLQKRLPLEGVKIVDGAAVPKFLEDPNYAQQAYVFSEPFVAEQAGGDPVNLLVSDLGFNPYTSLLIASAETLEKQPELVEKIVRASAKGWETYLADPEQTNQEIHKRNPEMSLEILAYGVESMRPLCQVPDGAATGDMTAERWQTLGDQLVEIEALKADAVAPQQAFTTKFLPSAETEQPQEEPQP